MAARRIDRGRVFRLVRSERGEVADRAVVFHDDRDDALTRAIDKTEMARAVLPVDGRRVDPLRGVGAQDAPLRTSYLVKQVTSEVVYLDGGSADGLAEGIELRVTRLRSGEALVNARETASIRVIAVAPGFADTESTRTATGARALADTVSKVPLRRLAKPDEIAAGVIAAIQNDFFNGKVFELDGGLVL